MRLALVALALAACTRPDPPKPVAPVASSTPAPVVDAGPALIPGTFAVDSLINRSGAFIGTASTGDVIVTEMKATKRFGPLLEYTQERNDLGRMYEALWKCDAAATCPELAQRAKALGVTDIVDGDVLMFEAAITGRVAKKRLPAVSALGRLDDAKSYAICVVAFRVSHVGNDTARASATVSAIVPASDTGMDFSAKDISLGFIATSSHSGFSDALRSMFHDAVAQLTAQLSP